VIVPPPVDVGAVHWRLTCVLPAVPLTAVGAPGTVAAAAGVNVADGAESRLVAVEFVAATVNV
jgi:hypothetical protein